MEQSQLKQRIDDLQFYLFQRPLHPELFRINQVKRVEQRRYTAEIWIVGLSHVVTVQYGKDCLTELITDETGISADEVALEKSFTDDLDIDSLSMVEIAVQTEDKYGVKVSDEDLAGLRTVGDVVAYVQKLEAENPEAAAAIAAAIDADKKDA